MKTFLLILVSAICLASLPALAQQKANSNSNAHSTVDLKFGLGYALAGTGDMRVVMFENELTKKWHRLFSNSLALNFGYSNNGVNENTTVVQANLNLFLSPFGNDKRNNFKIGGGLSYAFTNDVRIIAERFENGVSVDRDTQIDERRALGANAILENETMVGKRYLIGLKAIVQPYFNGDITSGFFVKFGLKL